MKIELNSTFSDEEKKILQKDYKNGHNNDDIMIQLFVNKDTSLRKNLD